MTNVNHQATNDELESTSEQATEDGAASTTGKRRRPGEPIFPASVKNAIVKKAMNGARHVDLAKEYNTRPENIGRWVKDHKAAQTAVTKKAKMNGDTHRPDRPILPSIAPMPVHDRTEVERLRTEIAEMQRKYGKLAIENADLRERLGNKTRRGE